MDSSDIRLTLDEDSDRDEAEASEDDMEDESEEGEITAVTTRKEGGGGEDTAVKAGLAIKNPPKKTHLKTHPKKPTQKNPKRTPPEKPTKNGFFGFYLNFYFFENSTNFSL